MKIKSIKKREEMVRIKSISLEKKPDLVPCGFCGGALPTVWRCPRCRGKGKLPRKGILVRPPAPPKPIRKLLVEEDLVLHGFEKSGFPTEGVDQKNLSNALRAWLNTSEGSKERTKVEYFLATAGWFRRPLTMEEVLKKYPPKPEPVPVEKPTSKKIRPTIRVRRIIP